MRPYVLRVYQSVWSGRWYWRVVAPNGRIIADSAEGYSSKGNAKKAVDRLRDGMFNMIVEEITEI